MKKIAFFCLLFLLPMIHAQTIAPSQIKPGSDGQVISTVGGKAAWSNAASSVSSVFGRIGDVIAQPGDYDCSKITNAICSLPSLFNQTIKVDGTAKIQRGVVNLINGSAGTVSCVDNNVTLATDCTFTGGNSTGIVWSVNDVSGSHRFYDGTPTTVYQNTTSNLMFIAGSATTSGSSVAGTSVHQGPTAFSLPFDSWDADYGATISGGNAAFSAVIKPGNYYRVDANGAVTGVGAWTQITGSGSGGGGGGSGPTLETDGVSNASQTLLNLKHGSHITLTNSGGDVTIDALGSCAEGTCVQNAPTQTQTVVQPAGTSLNVNMSNSTAPLAEPSALNVQGGNGLVASSLTSQPGATPLNVIYDNDDIAGDGPPNLGQLESLIDQNIIKVIGMVSATEDLYAPAAMNLINKYYGHLAIPVGANQAGSGVSGNWTQLTVAQFCPSSGLCPSGDNRANYPACVTTLRTALASLPAGQTAVYLLGGQWTCLDQLLNSPADGISSMTGAQLIKAKVSEMITQSMDLPGGTSCGNIDADLAAAEDVMSQWNSSNGFPAIYFNGSIGDAVISGVPSWFSTTNPLAYTVYVAGNGTPSGAWDQVSLLYALYSGTAEWSHSANGTATITGSGGAGTCSFSAGSSSGHFYIIANETGAYYSAQVDGLFYGGANRHLPLPVAGHVEAHHGLLGDSVDPWAVPQIVIAPDAGDDRDLLTMRSPDVGQWNNGALPPDMVTIDHLGNLTLTNPNRAFSGFFDSPKMGLTAQMGSGAGGSAATWYWQNVVTGPVGSSILDFTFVPGPLIALGKVAVRYPSIMDSELLSAPCVATDTDGTFIAGTCPPTPIANITIAVSGGTQAANSCSSASTATMTGLATSSVVLPGYSGDPTAITGWGGATTGMTFKAWPSAANTVSWKVCNETGSSITYSAITFNVGAR